MTMNEMSCELFNDRLMAYLERETDDTTRAAMERHSVTCAECGLLLADLRKLRTDSANLPRLAPSRDLWSGIAARIETPVVSIGVHQVAQERSARLRRWTRGAAIAASLVAAAGIGYLARGGGSGPSAPTEIPTPVAEIPADTPLQVAAVVVDSAADAASNPAPTVANAANRRPGAIALPALAQVRPLEVQLAAREVASLAADYDREIARLRVLIELRRNQLDPVTVAIIEKNLVVIDTAIADSKKAIARDPASRFLIESLNHSLRSKVELMRTAALLPSRT